MVFYVCNLISSMTEVEEITVFRSAWTVVPVKHRKKNEKRNRGKMFGGER